VGDIDQYQLPDAKGFTSMVRHLTGEDEESRQKMQRQVPRATRVDFQSFGEIWTPHAPGGGTSAGLGDGDSGGLAKRRAGWKVVKVSSLCLCSISLLRAPLISFRVGLDNGAISGGCQSVFPWLSGQVKGSAKFSPASGPSQNSSWQVHLPLAVPIPGCPQASHRDIQWLPAAEFRQPCGILGRRRIDRGKPASSRNLHQSTDRAAEGSGRLQKTGINSLLSYPF